MAKAVKQSRLSDLQFVPPTLARLAAPPEGPEWIHEVKFDGYRVQAHIAKSGRRRDVRIYTRGGHDWTERFGGLVADLAELPVDTAILDGEALAFDQAGKASFSALQAKLKPNTTAPSNITMVVFDILHRDGRNVRDLPLSARLVELGEVIGEPDRTCAVQASERIVGAGRDVFRKACELGLEGIVSKRLDRPYRSGRHGDWIKAKCVRTGLFVVVGYVPSKPSIETVGSLVIAFADAERLVYAGRVGTGFSIEEATAMVGGLNSIRRKKSPLSEPLKASQTRDVVWVEPLLIAEVSYRDVTADGLLRHASFQRFRSDKSPADTQRP